MFKQFHIVDLGRDPKIFDLEAFWKYDHHYISGDKIEETGSTLPIFMSKKDYLKVGGWDESYPGHWVVDWEFFMKCGMVGMKMLRTWNCHFYHFVSVGTKSPERIDEARIKEQACHGYFRYKWGDYAKSCPFTNRKYF
jgi:predicted glycosyltransferase involved in capsule biosynthesis